MIFNTLYIGERTSWERYTNDWEQWEEYIETIAYEVIQFKDETKTYFLNIENPNWKLTKNRICEKLIVEGSRSYEFLLNNQDDIYRIMLPF